MIFAKWLHRDEKSLGLVAVAVVRGRVGKRDGDSMEFAAKFDGVGSSEDDEGFGLISMNAMRRG